MQNQAATEYILLLGFLVVIAAAVVFLQQDIASEIQKHIQFPCVGCINEKCEDSGQQNVSAKQYCQKITLSKTKTIRINHSKNDDSEPRFFWISVNDPKNQTPGLLNCTPESWGCVETNNTLSPQNPCYNLSGCTVNQDGKTSVFENTEYGHLEQNQALFLKTCGNQSTNILSLPRGEHTVCLKVDSPENENWSATLECLQKE